jgi:hypothetical protein
MEHYVLPDAVHLRHHLEMLFGDGLEVHPAATLGADAPYCGAYRNNAEEPVAVCLCDKAFAAYAGAALSMLMPNDARKAAEHGTLTDVMRANLYEVMNILSSLFMNEHTQHLRMREMSTPATMDAAVKAIATAPSSHADFKVEIPRYGSGRLVLALK